ncbi:uncharacterized protein LOC143342705 isoform X2 [Colletes latitarsis]|uniref:uncharacterized protein LOC143342705 isoform X2 n=1 Tax=Colletes latitarsis TaxID=2605962 RepID=UPI0040371A96
MLRKSSIRVLSGIDDVLFYKRRNCSHQYIGAGKLKIENYVGPTIGRPIKPYNNRHVLYIKNSTNSKFIFCQVSCSNFNSGSSVRINKPMCTPISASSKVIQLLAILRAKNADTVSPITWFISAFTNLTRVFTIWMDSADILLLGNFIISVLLSSSIMLSAIYYRRQRVKQD